jgi:hypothetical protein
MQQASDSFPTQIDAGVIFPARRDFWSLQEWNAQ